MSSELILEFVFIAIVFIVSAGFVWWTIGEGVNDTKMGHYVDTQKPTKGSRAVAGSSEPEKQAIH